MTRDDKKKADGTDQQELVGGGILKLKVKNLFHTTRHIIIVCTKRYLQIDRETQ